MRSFSIALVLLIISITITRANIPTLGAGTSNSVVLPACGIGVINLSTGCTQPMLGGL